MDSHTQFARIEANGVVAIVRGVEPARVVDVVEAIIDGGITTIEITADSPDVLESLDRVTDRVDDDVVIGAGTVLDPETAVATVNAGAEFLVTPTLDEGVIRVANRYDALVAPGVATPTEALTAFEAGADMAKVFPASTLGPDYVSSIDGPLGQIPLLPTGGVSADNVADFFEAGATAVGVGSAIVDDQAVADGDYERIRENAEVLLDAIPAN